MLFTELVSEKKGEYFGGAGHKFLLFFLAAK